MEKPYAVIHFFEQNSYSEIPSNWLLDTDESTGVTDKGDDNNKKPQRNKFLKDITLINDHAISNSSECDTNIIYGGDGDGDERFHTLNNKLDLCLKLLGTLVVDMKDLKQRIAINDANYCEMNETELNVKNDLPLNSREEVSTFNAKLLESKDYHREFVKVVNQIGGANGKEYTERVLNTIFSTSFAAVNSWEGKKTKFKLSDLKLIKTCEEVILKKFTSWDSAEFTKVGTNWFRLGNQRAGLQKGQIQKQEKHEATRKIDADEFDHNEN